MLLRALRRAGLLGQCGDLAVERFDLPLQIRYLLLIARDLRVETGNLLFVERDLLLRALGRTRLLGQRSDLAVERFDLALQIRYLLFIARDLRVEACDFLVLFADGLVERPYLLLQLRHIAIGRVAVGRVRRLQLFDLLFKAGNLVVPLVHALFERFDLLLQFSHVGAFPATRLQLFDLLFEAGNLVVPFIHALLERFDLLLQLSHVSACGTALLQFFELLFEFGNAFLQLRHGGVRAARLQLFDLLFEAGNLVVPFVHALLERFNLLLQFSHVSAFSATRLQIFDLLFETGNLVVPLVHALLQRFDGRVPLLKLLLQLRDGPIRVARACFQFADARFQFENIGVFFLDGIVRAVELGLQLGVGGRKIVDALVQRGNLLVQIENGRIGTGQLRLRGQQLVGALGEHAAEIGNDHGIAAAGGQHIFQLLDALARKREVLFILLQIAHRGGKRRNPPARIREVVLRLGQFREIGVVRFCHHIELRLHGIQFLREGCDAREQLGVFQQQARILDIRQAFLDGEQAVFFFRLRQPLVELRKRLVHIRWQRGAQRIPIRQSARRERQQNQQRGERHGQGSFHF